MNQPAVSEHSEFLGLKVDLGRAAHAVTKALDYVGVDDKSHGRRVGLICHRIAHYLDLNREERHFLLLAGMLHDAGVSSTAVHQKLVDELEWKGAEQHCVRGERFLSSFPPFAKYAEAVRYHHTRWEHLPESLPEKTKLFANIIFLSDRLDVLYARYLLTHSHHKLLLERDSLLDKLRPLAGTLFDERIFQALLSATMKDSFWLELRDEFLDDAIFETLDYADYSVNLGFDEIESLGELISQVVDAKSPFTHYHSIRVADIACHLAELVGYDTQISRMIRIAGLLHDVGKLRTPDEILEKPGPLTPEEAAQMHAHPIDSKMVLKEIFPNTPIATWASQHHEKLDGSGYPFGWSGDQIERPVRILSVADIFQALCQKRPYRERLDVDSVIGMMELMADDGKIDRSVLNMLKSKKSFFYSLAIKEASD